MQDLLIFIICFCIIYFIYLCTVVLRDSKIDIYISGKQIQFFVKKYGLTFKTIKPKRFINMLSLVNSFIMAFTITIIVAIDNIILKFLLAFVILLLLIFISYSLIGLYIKKKEGK